MLTDIEIFLSLFFLEVDFLAVELVDAVSDFLLAVFGVQIKSVVVVLMRLLEIQEFLIDETQKVVDLRVLD